MQNRDEDKLQAALWELIQLRRKPGVLAWAVCNNPRSAPDGARLKRMGMVPGIPDLHFYVDGKFQVLEVKTEKGVVSNNQFAWHKAFIEQGVRAEIGRGWNECVDALQYNGVLLPGTYHKSVLRV